MVEQTIESLPNEILVQIFSKLNTLDLFWGAALVCKRWHSISLENSFVKSVSPVCWTHMEVLIKLIKRCKYTREFTHQRYTSISKVIQELGRNCSYLTICKLRSPSVSQASLKSFARGCPRLRILHLSLTNKIRKPERYVSALGSLKHLETLRLVFSFFDIDGDDEDQPDHGPCSEEICFGQSLKTLILNFFSQIYISYYHIAGFIDIA